MVAGGAWGEAVSSMEEEEDVAGWSHKLRRGKAQHRRCHTLLNPAPVSSAAVQGACISLCNGAGVHRGRHHNTIMT